MLDIINRYTHGYVAMPLILACHAKGLFHLLATQKLTSSQLAKELRANEGYLCAALRLFVSLGWMKKEDEAYQFDAQFLQLIEALPKEILSLYHVSINQFLRNSPDCHLVINALNMIEKVNKIDPIIADFFAGVLIVPLLVALKQSHPELVEQSENLFKHLPKNLQKPIKDLFIKKQWAEEKSNRTLLTDAGKFMLERAFNMATAASYAPMLRQIDTLLFGDPQQVFQKNAAGHEAHVDRTLNVIGSGFQHVRYFKDAEDIIISIFNKQPLESQPKYIIDTGCGDGTLLKEVYEIIRDKSARGEVLTHYPLYVIGVDYNKKSIKATDKTLQDIPHYTLQGDIGDPEKIINDLKKIGISDPEDSLHIRSFLDHDRPYIPPKALQKLHERSHLNYQGVYINAEGKLIPPAEMVQSLVEHLSRWSAIISRHGLLVLEVHCLAPETIFQHLNQNESLHFDAYHALSKQYLVEADVFLMAAAEAGLFPKIEFSRRYPQTFPYTRITLNFFEKRNYTVEYAKCSDLPALLRLEQECWASAMQLSEQDLLKRLERFPAGQLVVRMQEKVVGVVYTQRITDDKKIISSVFNTIIDLHEPHGKIVQLLGINIAADMQATGIGSQVRDFVLWWAALKGIEKVVGVTRCKAYKQNTTLSMQEYVQKHIETPGGIDPILRFHTSRGASIKAIIPNYRPEDSDNQGAGVLIEYKLINAVESNASKKQLEVQQQEKAITETINQALLNFVPENQKHLFSTHTALRDMGFDSLSLLELRALLAQYFSCELDPTFFFEYNTPAAIHQYFKQRTPQVEMKDRADSENIARQSQDDSIAVIGMDCRLPGKVNHTDAFWDLLQSGRDAITAVPDDRRELLQDSITHGGFLTDVNCFDAQFFRISPREAELMDPQQRILLEVVWSALEGAGINPQTLAGTPTGVFVGIFSHDYESLLLTDQNKNLDVYYATGNSASTAAGRIAYNLGLQGPAMAVNTACSSSLVAVHLACQSLRNNESTLAIATGVNLILAPELNIAFNNAGMLAPDGKCKTFDAKADGYVRSEGCGVVVLKKLSQAIADQDNILAVIRATAINQDGASNGLTAPSKPSQVALLSSTLKAAHVPACSISYIEAHGTGTALGDPIEIKAISEVYADRDKHQPLFVGSVKTNIGHTEAAAGIAGLIKVILMLKHQQIPPHLHFSLLNPHIHLPPAFIIPTTSQPWLSGNHPRRAAVSAFGFSGTNAHVVLEEAPNTQTNPDEITKPCLFAFSAKTLSALARRLQDFKNWLENDSINALIAISYTLNVCRGHFEIRYAIIASTKAELLTKLTQVELISKSHHEAAAVPQDCYKQLKNPTTYDKALSTLADFYTHGADIEWTCLYENSIRKVLLPSYPFDKQHYWLPTVVKPSKLHPLLDENTSTINQLSFIKTLHAQDFYLIDHQVNHQAILPGVVYLEMALAAGSRIFSPEKVIGLTQIVWARPVEVKQTNSVTLKIGLQSSSEGIEFLITQDDVLHAKGKLNLAHKDAQSDMPAYELSNIKARCKQLVTGVYETFAKNGLNYGPSFQGIEALWHGGDEVLAKLTPQTLSGWTFHPGMLDSVLQTALALTNFELKLPFAVEEINIFSPVQSEAALYAYACKDNNDRFSACLLNETGLVHAAFKHISMRDLTDKLYYYPYWVESSLTPSNNIDYKNQTILIICPKALNLLHDALVAKYTQSHIETIWLEEDCRALFSAKLKNISKLAGIFFITDNSKFHTISLAQEQGVIALFYLIKSLIHYQLLKPALFFKVVTTNLYPVSAGEKVCPYHAEIPGLIYAFAHEYPAVSVSCIDISHEDLKQSAKIAKMLSDEPSQTTTQYIAIRNETRYVRVLAPIRLTKDAYVFKKAGIYLIVGGTGGIGFVMSKYLAQHYHAKLIWIGRSPKANHQEKIAEIIALGGNVFYCQTKVENLEQAIDFIKSRFSKINGVIHSALVLKDKTIANMDEATLHEALMPKVQGSLALYEAFKDDPLDFLLFFSSIQSFQAYAGQSNYAAGSTFQDAFADYLQDVSSFPVKLINWGYWGSVGVVAAEQYQTSMRARGIESINSAEGMKAIEYLLGNPINRLVTVKASQEVLAEMGLIEQKEVAVLDKSIPSCFNTTVGKAIEQAANHQLPDINEDALLHDLSLTLIIHVFQQMGVFINASEVYQIDELRVKLGILPKYTALYNFLIELLINNYCLERIDKQIKSLSCALMQQWDLQAIINKKTLLCKQHPALQAHINLLWACIIAYPQVLTGKISHMDIMFPQGSIALVEGIYQDYPLANYYNTCVASYIRAYTEQRLKHDPQAQIVVLEAGAGTGGTSGAVLKVLADFYSNIKYIYTDISPGFINLAKEKWANHYPWMEFKKWNIELPPAEQDFNVGTVDIIFATNVLHATKHIHHTLTNIKLLLKRQGILVLNEIIQRSNFVTLTFGLTDGWWLFEDKSSRIPYSPLLPEKAWYNHLKSVGFNKVARIDKQPTDRNNEQGIFVAESNGVFIDSVHQKLPSIKLVQPTQPAIKHSISTTLEDKTKFYLKTVFAKVLKSTPETINDYHTFEQYGVDSLITLEINKALSDVFDVLPSTLLFEYMTINKLAQYFIQNHHDKLHQLFDVAINPRQNHQRIINTQRTLASASNDIAIIGCTGRYPEANNLWEFWQLLLQGKNTASVIPKDRWDWEKYYDETPGKPGKMYSKFGCFIQHADKFDPLFFNIPPIEAENIDPQERLFLESAWAVLEDAGYTAADLETIANRVGVFVGVMNHDYSLHQDTSELANNALCHAHWSIANRVSYYFDFKGPSIAIDTACSSSLTALHLACQSLDAGECELAIAGGVNLILRPEHYINLCRLHMLSAGDACRAFGEGADGFVAGEGVGALLLKPLDKAIAAGDLIYGVIKATAINAGGKTSGYTVPNPNAQAEVISRAIKKAAINPADITYIEAHGTGTALGDPIEIAGLNKVFTTGQENKTIAIGSVKTNIGHLESAAGIAGITKVLLQMQHGQLVPSLHAERLNSHIHLAHTPFTVQQVISNWHDEKRIASVSSFGAGGSNACVILAAGPTIRTPSISQQKPYYLFTFSAKTKNALKQRLMDLKNWLSILTTPVLLENISYTLNAKRQHFGYRAIITAASLQELRTILDDISHHHYPANYLQNEEDKKAQHEPVFTELLAKLLEDIKAPAIEQAVYAKKLLAIGDLYIKGYDIDWSSLHAGEMQQKLSLPSYPFAKERYWLVQDEVKPLNMVMIEEKDSLFDKISAQIKRLFADTLKMQASGVDITKNLSEYGLDSIYAIALTDAINHFYQLKLIPAIWFEHSNLSSFISYLLSAHLGLFEAFYNERIQRHIVTASPQKPLVTPHKADTDDIAIIGMSALLPGANNLEQFWENLLQNKNVISEIPTSRWDWQAYYGDASLSAGKTKIKWGGFIDGMEEFDAGFFKISPREAELMDPQQRLFLQIVWKTIEDAGYACSAIAKLKTGLFVGAVNNDYAEMLTRNNITEAYTATSTSRGMIANRISYLLNLQGPSEVVDTACSSSLVAIRHAVQAIQSGDCELAIAGGVNALLTPSLYIAADKAGMLSMDGKCKPFDKHANGYVRSEGVAAVLLKPLHQAIADKDTIYGVIKSIAVNHGGHVSSLTVPNPNAQAEVIELAIRRARVDISHINYIEAHGTGTTLGDPIEINGLKKAFASISSNQNHPERNKPYCYVGSVKSHIGHLESAAGVTSLIKVLLAMRHGMLPGNLHFETLNPYIEIEQSPFSILDKSQVWERVKDRDGMELPYCAGISSFGFGGVNAHMVVQEYKNATVNCALNKPYYLIVLSAPDAEGLQQKINDLYTWLNQCYQPVSLAALSFTLAVGRDHFTYRAAWVVASLDELISTLKQALETWVDEAAAKPGPIAGPVINEIYHIAIKAIQSSTTLHTEDYREKLLLLADLYVKHYPINWDQLYDYKAEQRLSGLPTYPFKKTRYWLDTKPQAVMPAQLIQPSIKIVKTNRQQAILNYLLDIFADKIRLPVEKISPEETYEVYGVESLLSIEIINRLEEDFGPLPKTLLYEKNKLTDLAHYFQMKHAATLKNLLVTDEQVETPSSEVVPTLSPVVMNEEVDIAIIGLSGTYPLAENLQQFWLNLASGKDCIIEVPKARWDYRDYPVLLGGEEKYYQFGGFIDEVDKFDPLFFNIAPRDAALMDPQERLFMQTVWATIENAGYTRESLQKTANNQVGVFAGVTYNFYPLFIAEEWQRGNRLPLDIQLFSIANRISYFMNFTGPSFIVDTACSSSLAAIHLACESIRRGECKLAVAGGVNLSLHPVKYHMLGSYNFMSEQGRCMSFGANGTGYVPGEGVGAVLLKPLAMAIQDHDHIYGVIKSSAMNHGGKTSGYTVPNPNAQTELIKTALSQANIHPRSISYIEAHGTGTSLGDPIEIRGLQEAFEAYTQDKQFCAIGSVKSNIGHLESAAGISQLTKVLLQLKHKKLVPSLHAQTLNPYIDFTHTPFFVQQKLSEWQGSPGTPRRAGISSFGAGGTNIHLIVEEYVPAKDCQMRDNSLPLIFLLSGVNLERLQAYASDTYRFLKIEEAYYSEPDKRKTWIESVCYTSQVGRENMSARLAILAFSYEDLLHKLQRFIESPGQPVENCWCNTVVTDKSAISLLDEYIASSNFAGLAQHWAQGATIAWAELYSKPMLKTAFPGYPFMKRRCWVTNENIDEKNIISFAQAKTAIDSVLVNDWLYHMQWLAEPLNNLITLQQPEDCWLVFLNAENELLKSPNPAYIYCVKAGNFQQIAGNVYTVNAAEVNDYKKLFDQVRMINSFKGMLYHADFDEAPSSFLILLKTLTDYSWQIKPYCCLITFESRQVLPEDDIQFAQHHLWSLLRIFAVENTQYQPLLLDLDDSGHAALKIILQEINHYQLTNNHIAYRKGQRYSLRFSLLQQDDQKSKTNKWQPPAAAIITGGLGAIGGEIACWLATYHTKYLLLTGTTQLPPREEWPIIQDKIIQEKIRVIQNLEQLGAHVRYAAVNSTDKLAMEQAIRQAESAWNQSIEGVFHLAGVTTDNVPIANLEQELLQQVLAAKIQGTLVLSDLFQHKTLKCFVMFSSVSALPYFGINGLSAYAAANEFLNGFAEYRHAQGLPATSINWAAWSDKGMSFHYNHSAFMEAMGMAAISPQEGLAALEQIMDLASPVVSVIKINWDKFLEVNPDAKKLHFFKDFVKANSVKQPAMPMPLSQDEICGLITSLSAELLALDVKELDLEVPFQHYGMDSILAVDFVGRLNQHFPGTVSPMDLYRYPTIRRLANYIDESYQASAVIEKKVVHSDLEEAAFLEGINHLENEEIIQLIESELNEFNERQ